MPKGREGDQDPRALPPEETQVTPELVRGEVKDFRRAHESRRRQLPRALTVGLAAGLVAVVFRWALVGAEAVRTWLFASAHRDPIAAVLVPPLWGALLAGAAVYTTRRYAPEASGSGIPHVKAVLHRLRGMVWQRLLLVKFVGGVFGMAAGLALGREGPTIQMGAGLGQMVSRWWQCTPRERQTLIAAGAGAGLAAAFNAPLAGLVFVLEELQRDFTPAVFTSAFVASVTADVVARLLTGQLPVFHMELLQTPSLPSLMGFLLLGLVTGVLGVVFNSTLSYTLDLYHRLRHLPIWVAGTLAGGFVGLAGAFWPQSLGGGQRLLESVLSSPVASPALLGFLLLRFGMTMVSYGSGAPGGIFAPLMGMGAQIGVCVALLWSRIAPSWSAEPGAFAVVGMAAFFSAIVRAPLTGIVLIIEMTGNYSLMLPLLVAGLTAYGTADLLGDRPIYEALLERDLLRGQDAPGLEETLLLEVRVAAGSRFAGKQLRELGLPAGCLVVSVRRGLQEEVPCADTDLRPGDHLTLVVAPRAASAIPLIRKGVSVAKKSGVEPTCS